MELVGSLGPSLERRTTSDPQGPDRLDVARPVLRSAGRLAVERRPGGGFSVDGIGLSASSPELPVGSIDLDDLVPGRGEEPAIPAP
jgi:hypothetical protein